MWPEPNPPLGDAPGEHELAAFVRSAILAGVGATALHRQLCARFRPRPGAKQWHRTSIQRVVKRERRALQLRAWLETEPGRSELAAEAARLVHTASLTFGVLGLSSAASRLALAETFTRAAQGAASPAELDQLAATLARLERRPGRKGGHS